MGNIETTRGLPSFSEMYAAFKNKGSIADSINAGVGGYFEGKKEQADVNKKNAEAVEAKSHGKYYDAQVNGGIDKKVPLASLSDEARAKLAPYVDANGMIPEAAAKVYLSTTAQGQAADKATSELELKQKALEEQTKHQKEMTDIQQQLATLKEALGQKGQALSAAQTVATTNKSADPSLLETLAGKAGEALNMPGIVPSEYKRAKQFDAATETLSGTAGIKSSEPQVTPSPTPAPAPAAVQPPPVVQKPGKPVAVYTEDDYNKLKPGASFIDGSGKVKIKGQ